MMFLHLVKRTGFSRARFEENRFDYIFFFVIHVVFSCVIFSIHETVVLVEVIGILLVAPIYAVIHVPIFNNEKIDYFMCQAIFKVLLIAFGYLQYNVNELLLSL